MSPSLANTPPQRRATIDRAAAGDPATLLALLVQEPSPALRVRIVQQLVASAAHPAVAAVLTRLAVTDPTP